jgi:hypothetical protein
MGERDVTKKVLELPIPRYKRNDERHHALADLGARARAHASVLVSSKGFPKSLAQQRAWIRDQLKELLTQIDRIVKTFV